MIARSFIFGLGIFLLYNLALWLFAPTAMPYATQSEWQVNLIKLQDYALAPNAKPNAIVGSSLAARLVRTSLDEEFHHLALVSDGPLTGLEVLRRQGTIPRVLLIETNLLLREENAAALDNTFRPILSHFRPHLPALQERYQPANVLAGQIGERILRRTFRTLGQFIPDRPAARAMPLDSDRARQLFEVGLAEQRAATDVPADAARLAEHLRRLQIHVDEFERRGSRCIFLEMPTDPSLMNLRQPREIRTALLQAFPEDKYRWIRPETSRRYLTTDGAHLTESEAKAYAHRIHQEIAPEKLTALSSGSRSSITP